jgi:hypothetical protein
VHSRGRQSKKYKAWSEVSFVEAIKGTHNLQFLRGTLVEQIPAGKTRYAASDTPSATKSKKRKLPLVSDQQGAPKKAKQLSTSSTFEPPPSEPVASNAVPADGEVSEPKLEVEEHEDPASLWADNVSDSD